MQKKSHNGQMWTNFGQFWTKYLDGFWTNFGQFWTILTMDNFGQNDKMHSNTSCFKAISPETVNLTRIWQSHTHFPVLTCICTRNIPKTPNNTQWQSITLNNTQNTRQSAKIHKTQQITQFLTSFRPWETMQTLFWNYRRRSCFCVNKFGFLILWEEGLS